jgi:hypothetical protein
MRKCNLTLQTTHLRLTCGDCKYRGLNCLLWLIDWERSGYKLRLNYFRKESTDA